MRPRRHLFDDWFDPIEAGLRDRVRDFIETMFRAELDASSAWRKFRRRTPSTRAATIGASSADDILATIKRFSLRTLETAEIQSEILQTSESGH